MEWYGTQLLDHVLKRRPDVMCEVHVGLEELRRTRTRVVGRRVASDTDTTGPVSSTDGLTTHTHTHTDTHKH